MSIVTQAAPASCLTSHKAPLQVDH